MRKNKFLRLTFASLLAVSTVFAVPVTAEEDTVAIETDLLTSPVTEQQPGSDNQPEFTAGFKEGVTQAVISLEDYLELHPEVISEISYGTSLEDYLLQTGVIQALASTGTWEQQSNGDWKFVLSNGSYASGWHEINGAWYYFDPYNSNVMVTGWEQIGGYWYYFNPSGSMKHGWLSSTRDGETIYYYMGRPGEPDTGAMYTGGWLHDIDGSWYYLYTEADEIQHGNDWSWETGVMHVGWLKVDENIYYLHTTDGHMATGANTMSPYIRSTFNNMGVWVSDYMIPQGNITTSTGTYQKANVRWDALEIIDGHRIPVVTIAENGIDDYFNTNYGVTPFNDAMNYFANNATEWFELEEEQPLYANITLAWYDFFDSPNYIPILYGVTVAQTCCMNSDGDWMFGEETPYDENPGTSYVTGTIVRSVIYVNTQIQDEPDIIDNPNNTTDFPKSIHNVVRHEILHALGLRHPHEFGEPDSQEYSLMYPSCMSIYTATILQDYDMNELRKTYPYNIWEE